MTIQDDHLRHAEECERLAATCLSNENRVILLLAAAQWRKLATAPAQGLASGIAVRAVDRRTFH